MMSFARAGVQSWDFDVVLIFVSHRRDLVEEDGLDQATNKTRGGIMEPNEITEEFRAFCLRGVATESGMDCDEEQG
jgi:hypothetical protein